MPEVYRHLSSFESVHSDIRYYQIRADQGRTYVKSNLEEQKNVLGNHDHRVRTISKEIYGDLSFSETVIPSITILLQCREEPEDIPWSFQSGDLTVILTKTITFRPANHVVLYLSNIWGSIAD